MRHTILLSVFCGLGLFACDICGDDDGFGDEWENDAPSLYPRDAGASGDAAAQNASPDANRDEGVALGDASLDLGGESCICPSANRCQARPQWHEPCVYFDECADGLACDLSGQCEYLPREGSPCASVGGLCADPAHFFCDYLQPVPVCTRTPQIGELCQSATCAEGAYCTFDDPHRCTPLPSTCGESCRDTGECAGGFQCEVSADFPAPGSSATCQPLHTVGEKCWSDLGCNANLFCNPDPDFSHATCQPRRGVGEPCWYLASSCLPGLSCFQPLAGVIGICRTPPSIGEACAHECADGAYCPDA